MEKIIRWFVGNKVAANLAMIFIIISGILTIPLLKMEVFPSIEIDIININALGDNDTITFTGVVQTQTDYDAFTVISNGGNLVNTVVANGGSDGTVVVRTSPPRASTSVPAKCSARIRCFTRSAVHL